MGSVKQTVSVIAVSGLLFGFASGITQGHASPESSALIDQGVAELQNAQWKEALQKFLSASIADPKDAEAQYFQGVALNRLSLHKEALGQIERARAAKVKNSNMDFEYGWALLGSGQPDKAVGPLQAFKKENPDSAKTSELIGRAELALGNKGKADAAFAEAVRLDPKLQASVDYFKAGNAARSRDTIGQNELLSSVAENTQGGTLSRTMRAHLDLLRSLRESASTSKPWDVFATATAGRNSNVIALSEGILRPAEITRTDSRYISGTGGGQYRQSLDVDKAVIVGGILNRTEYLDIGGNNTDTVNVFLRYEQQVTPRFLAALAGSFNHVRVDGTKAQNTFGIGPSLEYQVNDVLKITGFASSQKINLPPQNLTPAILDRDSKLHVFGGNVSIAFPDLRSDITFGASLLNNSAVGSDYDYNAHNYNISGRTQLPWDITAGLGVSRTNYAFKNLNSLAPTTPPGATAFGFKREDTVTIFNANLTRPIDDRFTAFVRASRTNANSNLVFFTYDQKDIQIGVTARF